MPESLFEDMLPSLPHRLTRKDIKKYFGSLISPKYLANLDSAGKGPRMKIICNKASYKTTDFVEWLQSRVK